MSKKVLIFGFYGYNNTGDEMILAGMVESLRRRHPDLDISVLTADPKTTEAQLPVRAVYAGRRSEGLGVVWRAIRDTDLFILGGGGLLQDRERRILPFWFSRVGLAKALGKKVMFYGLGVGPVTTRLGERQIRYFGNRVDWITVRDAESADILRRCGVYRPPMQITADPALAIESLAAEKPSSGRIGVCVRTWSGWEDKLPQLAKTLDAVIVQSGRPLEFLPLHGDADRDASEQVSRAMEQSQQVFLPPGQMEPGAVARRLGEMDLVVSMRLHGLILAGLQKVPCVGISYDPKVSQFMQAAGMGEWVSDFSAVQADDLARQILQAWANRVEIKDHLRQVIPSLQEKADKNADLASVLLFS